MNKKTYTLNTLLAVVLGAALLACVLAYGLLLSYFTTFPPNLPIFMAG